VRALGLTGADGDVLRARRRPVGTVDYGFVGDVVAVNSEFLASLLRAGILPVVAPLTHDGHGQLLNTNADTIAAEICAALAGTYDVHAYFCLDRPGVCVDAERPASVLPVIDSRRYAELTESGAISGGMLPKLRNAFAAQAAGARRVLLLRADALPAALAGSACVCTELLP
jgi:acetylglutamate kinase